jgi:hypothetical protein
MRFLLLLLLYFCPFQKAKSGQRRAFLQYNTPAASAAFLAGIMGPYRALAARLAGAFCFVVEQVCGFDGHVHDV